ncbi:subunit of the rna polymerase ii mediator complex [Trichoderma cornu-damae]|uniref:Subunit of the rna polymerase ii mediator complex n=1 Tax=Trichoderma cornu-damae TaxID=654480 RepID=A0A9P8U0K5_9HYPO|nr:subunit of the rna polymerase ii mediator complex [Trichoderma cornu-damae]
MEDGGSGSWKAMEAEDESSSWLPHEADRHDPLPIYRGSQSASASTLQQQQQPAGTLGASGLVPTVASPFDFPADGREGSSGTAAAPPAYGGAEPSGGSRRPVAFPQIKPDPDSPFLPAYAPVLLDYGISEQTWRSFLATISAFLTATVSDRALSHAADVAARIGQNPKNLGKSVAAHASSIGKNVSENAKRGNVLGAAAGLIGGSISLPISTALGIVGSGLSLPGQAISAVTKKPKTPQQRVAAYAAVANEEWLHTRGLHAYLYDSAGLARLLGRPVDGLLSLAGEAAEGDAGDAARQMRALEPHVARLEVDEGSTLQLKSQTLWIVLVPGSHRF